MVSRAIIIKGDKILLVNQWVERGDIVWTFPGGRMEAGETSEETCIREVKEETGFDVRIVDTLVRTEYKATFICEVVGGTLHVDRANPDNKEIIDVQWVLMNDESKFDAVTRPTIDLYRKKEDRK